MWVGLALILALALAPIVGGGFGQLTNGIIEILVFVALGLRLFRFRNERDSWALVPGAIAGCAFLALCILATLHTSGLHYSLTQMLFMLAGLGAYVLSAAVFRDKRAAIVAIWTLLVVGLGICLISVRGYILDAGGGAAFWKTLNAPGDHPRLFGPFINPNFFAGYLVLLMPVTLGAYLAARRLVLAVLAGLALLIEAIALLLTAAKFGILAAAVSMLVFLVLCIAAKALRRREIVRLVVICALTLPVVLAFSAPIRSRVEEAGSGGTQVHSTTFRVYTWRATLNMIKHQPLLGFGPGTYSEVYPRYTIAGPTKHAHNSYLQLAAECGVPALIALLALLAAIAWRSVAGIARMEIHGDDDESDPWADAVPDSSWKLICSAILAALVGSAVRSLADSDWYVIGIWLPFWAMAGALVARSGAADRSASIGKSLSVALAAGCVVLAAISLSFAMGDATAAQARSIAGSSSQNPQRVVDLYARASSFAPLDPEYHRMLAVWLGLGEGDFAQANDQIARAIPLDPSGESWFNQGTLASAQGDWRKAIDSYRRALEFAPKSTQVLDSLARVYISRGDLRSAGDTYRHLLTIEESPYERIKGTPEVVDTTYSSAHQFFADQYLRRKQFGKAVEEYQAAIDRFERWRHSGLYRKVLRMMEQGQEGGRIDSLKQCYEGLAEAYTGLGDKRKAAEALDKAKHLR